MSFEDNCEDFWSGRGGPNHSKRELLRVAVDCGAIMTGHVDGVEVPYPGVEDHAAELVADGCLELYRGAFRSECFLAWEKDLRTNTKIWVPTEIGKILCR